MIFWWSIRKTQSVIVSISNGVLLRKVGFQDQARPTSLIKIKIRAIFFWDEGHFSIPWLTFQDYVHFFKVSSTFSIIVSIFKDRFFTIQVSFLKISVTFRSGQFFIFSDDFTFLNKIKDFDFSRFWSSPHFLLFKAHFQKFKITFIKTRLTQEKSSKISNTPTPHPLINSITL